MEQCNTCKIIPKLLGKDLFLPLFGREYPKLFYNQISSCLIGLDLIIVGGLKTRGWTLHDIDVIGSREDIFTLNGRLKEMNVPNPIHFCGEKNNHSHLECTYYGIKLTLTGKGF